MLKDLTSSLPAAWLADAEISVPFLRGERGLSFFFEAPAEFADFLETVGAPPVIAVCEARVRERFDLVPRRWVKLQGEKPSRRFSQYFQVNPLDAYPLTTLRLFLRAFGIADVAGLEELLRPALERGDTVWGLVLKHGDRGAAPRLSLRVPRGLLGDLVGRLVEARRLTAALGAAYGQLALTGPGDDTVYLSFDPGVADACALDFEHVPSGAVPGGGAAFPQPVVLRYAKCRLGRNGGEPAWTGYLPYPAWRTYTERSPVDAPSRVALARAHYQRHHATILETFGPTYQAGWVRAADGAPTARTSNLALARRAGLAAGQRVLDAGCGRGGPACDIAEAIPGVRIDGIALCPAEAAAARGLARKRRCDDRVTAIAADFHALPLRDRQYDVALFLESLGYAFDLHALCAELRRVLHPGGWVYVKDVFVREAGVTEDERLELAEFDRTYAQCTRTRPAVAAAFERAGFRVEVNGALGDANTMDHINPAMVAAPGRRSAIGRQHFRRFRSLPVEFGEIQATAP